jgi:CTP synthase (UTP-ammonia lyase)
MQQSGRALSVPAVIGIVGDFDRAKRSHWATEAALFHAAARVGLPLEPRWLPTASLASADGAQHLEQCQGIWGAPGNPVASVAGTLHAIEFARRRDVPYLGTCAGFQYALVELTRNVLGVADADTAENQPEGKNIVITAIECAVPTAGGPSLSGADVATPVAGTMVGRLCGAADLRGEYFCSFETNAEYVPRWEAAGLRVAARGGQGEMRAFELPQQCFFVATLFQPQLSSSYALPHPLIEGFLRACYNRSPYAEADGSS